MLKYSLSSRIIHWISSILVLTILGIGIYMTDFLPKDSPNHLKIYELHKSLGVIALMLIIIRVVNRFLKKPPALPATMPKIEVILSGVVHFGLYVLLFCVPLSGYLMSNSFGFPVHLFGIEMPFLISTNYELGNLFAEAHELCAYALLGLVIIHILAAIKHRYFDKPEHDILKRMW
jgi:cytochrome b561